MAMTIEQQRALALAKSRRRRAAATTEVGQQPGNVDAPSSAFTDALADASKRSQFAGGPVTPRSQQGKPAGPDLAGATAATLGGIVNGIPVLGPIAQNLTDAAEGGIAALTGGDYGETVRARQERRADLAEANPIADIAGNLAGGVGAMGGLAKTAGGAAALGLEGSFGARVANSTASGAAISGADAAMKGGDLDNIFGNAALGGGIGAATPAIASTLGAAARAIGGKIAPIINSAVNPADEAARRTGSVVARDVASNPNSVLNAADEVAARAAGVPLVNVDRGGETTRALARAAANQSPEARDQLTKLAAERFETQGPRAVSFLKGLTNGNADDLAYQQKIKDMAEAANGPRYRAAYSDPKAQSVFTVETQELMQSPTFQRAIAMTEGRGKDMAAIAGDMPIVNPFRKGSDGVYRVVQKANGTMAVPNLQFWNQVKRNLDGMIGTAVSGGDQTEVATLTAMKRKLVGSLDTAVPEYQTARQGAASFFDAEDALTAGRTFANQPRKIPEATEAFKKFLPAEKEAFRTGFASELIDQIKAAGDTRNVISSTFGNQASREMIDLVFGSAKAKQLEAYVRVEALADRLRGALGNSTTARQLVELGIGTGVGGAAGFGLSGGDINSAVQGAAVGAGLKGVQMAGQRIDGNVMKEIAKLLTSDNPKLIERAVNLAARKPEWMNAIEALEQRLQRLMITTKGATTGEAA